MNEKYFELIKQYRYDIYLYKFLCLYATCGINKYEFNLSNSIINIKYSFILEHSEDNYYVQIIQCNDNIYDTNMSMHIPKESFASILIGIKEFLIGEGVNEQLLNIEKELQK